MHCSIPDPNAKTKSSSLGPPNNWVLAFCKIGAKEQIGFVEIS